jgi:hypothetical protein
MRAKRKQMIVWAGYWSNQQSILPGARTLLNTPKFSTIAASASCTQIKQQQDEEAIKFE